ncbi:2-C-methyl-D-erythritol 4-phosphate cytidylyltransferase [Desulfocicer vacuolatum DSM 3385]|uniref:2-C-methyl-D-erythritol 4-phosphate cytidylyltransferase n=1 Tax=Desulfocicer vacuolatum DSM 3385 TaxID=1121400 RepID=A0A1W2B7N3_9BACT|nr:2-C-methyl-D-erythritol 4-phosphate cytidylyltransferase [Desulfocicer vacuolatum]SMC69033.1 2-C-methyl-D-erythritol 4-phosphate cytidylyltransferase [Desulfocicer vacuolatum DSM 3385]
MAQPRVAVIVVAGGSGQRMNASIRKQYMSLAGLPVLVRTLNVFAPMNVPIFLVIPQGDMAFCEETILAPHLLDKQVQLVHGGKERQASVKNGLDALHSTGFSRNGIVLIHDGVRPFVEKSMLDRCIEGAFTHGACIPAVAVVDTLKRVDHQGKIVSTVSRDNLYQVQTPQAFRFDLVIKAHEHALVRGIKGTDDASLVEAMGEAVYFTPGSVDNIKLTTPGDLERGEFIATRF